MNRLLLILIFGALALPVFSKTLFFQNDTVPPVVVCPPSDTVVLSPGACSEVVTYTVEVSDNNPGVILTQTSGLASGATFPWGKTVNQFVATDTAGNTASCSFQVTLQQETSFLACESFVLVSLGDSCLAPLTLDMVLFETGSTPGCSTALVVQVKQNGTTGPFVYMPFFDEEDAGKNFQFRVLDTLTGNSCWGSIKVTGQLPDPVCSDLTLPCILPEAQLKPAFLRDSLGIATAFPAMPDNCGGAVLLTYTDEVFPGGCVDGVVEEIFRTWKATDTEGLTATCVQRMEIRQVVLQDVFFPNDTTYNLSCKNAWQTWYVINSPFTLFQGRKYKVGYQSCNISGQQNDVLQTLCSGTRRVTRHFSLLDACTNEMLVDSQYILLPDLAGPVVHCDSVRIVQANASNCNVSLSWNPISVSEYCSYTDGISVWWLNGTDTVRLQATILNGGPLQPDTTGVFDTYFPFPVGETVVTYEATDACGNVGSCQQTVAVWDNAPPVLSCANSTTVYLTGTGYRELTPSEWVLSATDNCNPVSYKIRREVAACGSSETWSDVAFLCCADIGDSVVFDVRAYDIPLPSGEVNGSFGMGQFNTCTVTIVVADTASLQCKAPQDTVVTCLESPLSVYGNFSQSCVVDEVLLENDFSEYDSLCEKGIVRRHFTVWDSAGASKKCTQTIVVNGAPNNLAIRFPQDYFVTNCEYYGTPMHFQNPEIRSLGCSRIEVGMTEQILTQVPGVCYMIERSWSIRDVCFAREGDEPLTNVPNPMPHSTTSHSLNMPGPVVSAPGTHSPWEPTIVKITPSSPAPTSFHVYWSDSTAGYTYKQKILIDDLSNMPEYEICPTNSVFVPDSTTNQTEFWNDSLIIIPARNLPADRPDAPFVLTARASDKCGYLTADVYLHLDLTGNTNRESLVSNKQTSLPRGKMHINNQSIYTLNTGPLISFDKRPVPDNEKYRFVVKTFLLDSSEYIWEARLFWEGANGELVPPQLPHGYHRAEWIFRNPCNRTVTCNYNFSVRDGMAPVLDCVDSLFLSLDSNAQAQITFEDVLLSPVVDNLTPDNKVAISLNKNLVANFPLDISGKPVSLLEYNCWSPTFQKGQLWAKDTAGNAGFCSFFLKVQDTEGFCNFGPVTLGGRIYTYGNRTMPFDEVYFDPQMPLVDVVDSADAGGRFQHPFDVSGVRFDIQPRRNHDPVNGVSTFDLVLINKHILDIETLDSPYKIIAADANGSRSVTTGDIAVLRRLILGVQDTLPGQLSWRFVDSAFVFSNPAHPFADPIHFQVSVYNPPGDELWHNLIGIKIGDVNDNAYVDSFVQQQVDNRQPLLFEIDDREVFPNDVIDLYFAPQTSVVASQFTLHFPGFEVLEMKPDAPLTTENVALFVEKNKLTFSNDVGGTTGLLLKMRALEGGFLSEKIKISDDITPAEAWTANGERLLPQLVFRKNENAADLFAQPSVFSDQTVLYYFLPSETDAALTVYNAAGQLLFQQSVPGTAGEHQFVLRAAMLNNATGPLAVQLRAGATTLATKVVRQ
ncbi:MAG: HYR domain-containing protein [Saprospiraceae bacterium]|nr:HYR domain-containing protein [Saprospiraceae bacterium]